MQDLTGSNLINFPLSVSSLYNPATLANPDFIDGFQAGIEAYEAECEDLERKLTYGEACADIRRNLDPYLQANSRAIERLNGWAERPLFDAGFMAGWLYAHLFYPETPVTATLPDTQPLDVVQPQVGKIIPIRMS